jgi:hypothetical protein
MSDDSFVAKGFWEAVIHISGSCGAFINIVMENQGFRQVPVEFSGKMIWNEKVEIAKVREIADYWMGCIDHIWAVRREFYRTEVFLVKKQVFNNDFFDVLRLGSRKGLNNDVLAKFDLKITKRTPSETKSRQAIQFKSSGINEVCLINMNTRNPFPEETVLRN